MSNITNDSQNKKQRLGRGLGSLLGNNIDLQETPAPAKTAVTQPASNTPIEARVWQIAVEKLVPSAYQPRSFFNKEKLQELATSIKDKGILQPIVARKLSNGAFEIIAGERRWRAAQIAGLYEVPVIIKTISNKETLELAIIENIQRENLSPIEEADAYQRLINEFSLTQQQVAERVGRERATVANTLRLLTLPADVRQLVNDGRLSMGHAKVLLGLDDAKKISALAKKATEAELSVRALEREVQNKTENTASEKATQNTKHQSAVAHVESDLQKHLGTKVKVDYSSGKGKVTIFFYSDDELTEITEKVKAGCKK